MKIFVSLILIFFTSISHAAKVKDLVRFGSYISGDITGYGIVVGLNGTGDRNLMATQKALSNMFTNFGMSLSQEQLKTRNSASVMVMAKIKGDVHKGQRIDIEVSSIGDALSIDGGLLLRTPLYDNDGNIIAFASGRISTGKKKTSGFISNGAEISFEKNVDYSTSGLKIYLDKPDFSNAFKISEALNFNFKDKIKSEIKGAGEINIIFNSQINISSFIALAGEIDINIDTKAKVVVNSLSGDVAITGSVEILPCSLTVGDIDIEVGGNQDNQSFKSINIKNGDFSELVKALNLIKAKPSQVVEIVKTLNAAGLIVADVEII